MFYFEVAYSLDNDVLRHACLRNKTWLLRCQRRKNSVYKHIKSSSPQKQMEKLTAKPLLQEVGTQRNSSIISTGMLINRPCYEDGGFESLPLCRQEVVFYKGKKVKLLHMCGWI